MNSFIISWPELDLKVKCEPIKDNKAAFDLVCQNLPINVVQGHELVGGWMLRDRSVHFGVKPFDIDKSELKNEVMKDAPEGRVFLLSPQGSTAELIIKYGETVDDRVYVPFAQVAAGDMEALKMAGKAAWKSATRTKEIILSKIEGDEKN